MSATSPFGRVVTAMVTPMRADGTLDLDGAQRVAAHLVAHGHDGLVVSGTTGEAPTTSDAEKADLIRAVREAVEGRAVVTAGAGTNDTAHSVELARQAEAAGADAVLVVTPYYSKPPQEGILAHITTVADATGLPVMVYDIPGRTGVPIHTQTHLRLAEHPRIAAVKDAKGDLFAATEVMMQTDLLWFSGDDALNLAHLTNGATGVVSVVGHVAGDVYAEMVACVDKGDLGRALELHRQAVPAVRAVMNLTQGAIMAKAALKELGVLESAAVRLPLVEATPDQVARLRDGLTESGLM
ncbi:4-hydroxy-tetrahydrodipicolinate synthase [Pedococcus sp. 5OH_020]|uniref:4-hydroxy-tetrahydrodipicolinate synthase n=1 Tax=Pedococcus sp. 5OH_020 TaxID=2989814 RepID=UPI0022E9C6D0|nr:4-hydroxy-tetrahydrodipicolinate synthase [Pedococcus sp. 5OH_020]